MQFHKPLKETGQDGRCQNVFHPIDLDGICHLESSNLTKPEYDSLTEMEFVEFNQTESQSLNLL
jgi:hypothetical protein